MEIATAVAELERIGLVFGFDLQGYPHLMEVADSTETISNEVQKVISERWQEVVAFLRERAAVPLRRDAEYAAVLEAASRSCARMTQPGMLAWLRERHPALHDDLTRRLPDFMSRLWDAHAPMEYFRRAVAELEFATERAVSLFLADVPTRRGSG